MPTYYFHPDDGLDANDGLTALTPKRYPWNATLANGDEMLLRAGTVFPTAVQWNLQNAANVSVSSYGDGPKPRIVGTMVANSEVDTISSAGRTGWSWTGIRVERPVPTITLGRAPFQVNINTVGFSFYGCEFFGGHDAFRLINNAQNTLFEDCDFSGCAVDALWSSPNGLTVRRCRFFDYGRLSENGDAVQTSGGLGVVIVEDCDMVMPLVSTKQAIIVGTHTNASGIAYIRYNRIHNPGSSTASIIAIEGQGEIVGNRITGNAARGLQISSRTTGHTVARIEHNYIRTDWTGANNYGVVIEGAHVKNVAVRNNTLIGGWGRGVFATATSMPSGSTYSGGNNLIDCRGAGRAFWNDSATAWTTANDLVRNTTGADIGSVTSPGRLASDPRITADGRPLPGSPLLTAGADLGYLRDIERKQSRRHIGAYGAARFVSA